MTPMRRVRCLHARVAPCIVLSIYKPSFTMTLQQHTPDQQPQHGNATANDHVRFSIIVPVFNRPDEVDEPLDSLTRQTMRDFEVVIVEDGSQQPCEDVCQKYVGRLPLHYYAKANSGPGQSRNYGVERARGEYVIILDSDVIVPEDYLKAVNDEPATRALRRLWRTRPRPSFVHTHPEGHLLLHDLLLHHRRHTRWKEEALTSSIPGRSTWACGAMSTIRLGGFSKMRFGEDIDFSIRIFKGATAAGCSPVPGYTTSAAPTSENSGGRCSTAASHASTSIRNIPRA